MELQRLEGKGFRNLEPFALQFSSGLHLILGANAAGKTNLLEAMAVLLRGRSPRIRDTPDLIHHQREFTHLKGKLEVQGISHALTLGLEKSGTRKLSLDQKPTRRLSELVEKFPLVTLFPEDLEIPKGSPSGRRAYLDRLAAQVVPGYLALRSRFEKVLRQRNAALKSRRPEREIRAYDPGFLREAVAIFQARNQVLQGLLACLAHLPEARSGESLEIEYWVRGREPEAIRRSLEHRLLATASDERRLKATQAGPQRDDFRISLSGVAVGPHASRGQLRSLMLRLALAEAQLVEEHRRVAPILLLDDALSDMDRARRNQTLSHLIGRCQVFLTAPEVDQVPNPVRIFSVEAGRIQAKSP